MPVTAVTTFDIDDVYILKFGQILLAIWTNIFPKLDKYIIFQHKSPLLQQISVAARHSCVLNGGLESVLGINKWWPPRCRDHNKTLPCVQIQIQIQIQTP